MLYMPMACSKSPMTFKGDCAAVSPLPSVLPLLHLILLCQSHPRIFYVCSTLHSEQSQNDLGHAHLLLFGIGIALRGMQAEARCTLHVASCCCTYLLFVVAVVMICDFFPHIDGHLDLVRSPLS